MQVEEIYNRSKLYVLVSLCAGLLYSGVLVGTTLLIGERLLTNHASRGAPLAGGVAIAVLILFGSTRERFQRAIDRLVRRRAGAQVRPVTMQKMNLPNRHGSWSIRGTAGATAPGGGG